MDKEDIRHVEDVIIAAAAKEVVQHIEKHTSTPPLEQVEEYDNLTDLIRLYATRVEKRIAPLLVDFVRTAHYERYMQEYEKDLTRPQFENSYRAACRVLEWCLIRRVVADTCYADQNDPVQFERDFAEFMDKEYDFVNHAFEELVDANRGLILATETRDACLQVFEGLYGPY